MSHRAIDQWSCGHCVSQVHLVLGSRIGCCKLWATSDLSCLHHLLTSASCLLILSLLGSSGRNPELAPPRLRGFTWAFWIQETPFQVHTITIQNDTLSSISYSHASSWHRSGGQKRVEWSYCEDQGWRVSTKRCRKQSIGFYCVGREPTAQDQALWESQKLKHILEIQEQRFGKDMGFKMVQSKSTGTSSKDILKAFCRAHFIRKMSQMCFLTCA